jgi:hypothetical protein
MNGAEHDFMKKEKSGPPSDKKKTTEKGRSRSVQMPTELIPPFPGSRKLPVHTRKPGVGESRPPSTPTESATQRELADLANEVRSMLTAVSALVQSPAEPAAQLDFGKAAELGKAMVAGFGKIVLSVEWHPPDAQQLESFVRRVVIGSIREAGSEPVARAAIEVGIDPASQEILSKLTEMTPQLINVADRVAEKIDPSNTAIRSVLRRLVLAGALLLAVGFGALIPIFAPAAAENVLANEVAIAAIVFGTAARIKHN